MSQASWEPKLQGWSVGPGKTEEEKMEHAVTAIRAAIDGSTILAPHDIEVLGTGSFKNRTHIPTESDVDVAVIYKDVFFNEWRFADSRAASNPAVVQELMREANVVPATYEFSEYKGDVEAALVAHFGRAAVRRGDIAFDIRENTYRVDSDCVAMFEHRQWWRDDSGHLAHTAGTRFISDSGVDTLNFPQQQFINGEDKHDRTDRNFKKVVRIVKNLCNEMNEAGIAEAEPIPSFLIECLIYQVPDQEFDRPTFYAELRAVLAWLFNNTMPGTDCSQWTEENEIKFLFHSAQPWTQEQAHAFISAAWDYVGLE
jgi:hypothetical protein